MRHVFPLLLLLMTAGAAAGQDPQPQPPGVPQSEEEQIEEEFIRTRSRKRTVARVGRASGARASRPRKPNATVVALRVGLNATTLNSTGGWSSEFASLHHEFVELTNTDGDVKVIDRSTGKEITVMSPGSLMRVEHDGTAFLVSAGRHLPRLVRGPGVLPSDERCEPVPRRESAAHLQRHEGSALSRRDGGRARSHHRRAAGARPRQSAQHRRSREITCPGSSPTSRSRALPSKR